MEEAQKIGTVFCVDIISNKNGIMVTKIVECKRIKNE